MDITILQLGVIFTCRQMKIYKCYVGAYLKHLHKDQNHSLKVLLTNLGHVSKDYNIPQG